MSERLGIRAAAREVGIPHATLYVAAARRLLPSEAAGGIVTFDRADLHRFKVSVVVERAAKEQAAAAALRRAEKKSRRNNGRQCRLP